ncbi:MAG: hypothetical protein ACC707_12330 [Thiohalomonadales bacterium]
MSKIIRFLIVFLVSQSMIFVSFAYAGQLALPSGDLVAPEITHEPLTKNIKAGASQQIKATVSDNVGVKTVTLFYRTKGSKDYKRINMNQLKDTDDYVATFGLEDTIAPGIEYYIQAVDLAGNALLYGYSFSPLVLGVSSSGSSTDVALSDNDSTLSEPKPEDNQVSKKKTNKWLWIGLGVLGAGIIAAAASSSSDSGGDPGAKPTTGSVTINAPVPGN